MHRVTSRSTYEFLSIQFTWRFQNFYFATSIPSDCIEYCRNNLPCHEAPSNKRMNFYFTNHYKYCQRFENNNYELLMHAVHHNVRHAPQWIVDSLVKLPHGHCRMARYSYSPYQPTDPHLDGPRPERATMDLLMLTRGVRCVTLEVHCVTPEYTSVRYPRLL